MKTRWLLSVAGALMITAVPQPVFAVIIEGTPLERSFVFRDSAYLLTERSLAVVDIAPSPPKFVRYEPLGGYPLRTSFDWPNNLLYVAANDAGVRIFEWSAPGDLTLLRTLAPSTNGYRVKYVELETNRVYFSESQTASGQVTWNLGIETTGTGLSTRVTVPVGTGTASTPILHTLPPHHLAVSFYTRDIRLYNVANLGNVFIEATMPVKGVVGLALKGGHLYALRGAPPGSPFPAFLEIWNIANPANPTRCSKVGLNRFVYDSVNNLTLSAGESGTFAYAGGTDGAQREDFLAVDVTDCTNATQVATMALRTTNGLWIAGADLDAVGNMVYVSGWKVPTDFPPGYEYYLAKVSITNTAQPQLMETLKIVSTVLSDKPVLQVSPTLDGISLAWPLPKADFDVEFTESLKAPIQWRPTFENLEITTGTVRLVTPVSGQQKYYRLKLAQPGLAISPED